MEPTKTQQVSGLLRGSLNRWAVSSQNSGDHTEKQGTYFVNVNIFIAGACRKALTKCLTHGAIQR